SEIAATAFAREFAACRKAKPQSGEGGRPPGGAVPAPTDELAGELTALRAAAKAAAEARSGVEELKDAAAAVGLGEGSPGSNDPARIAAAFKRVRGDPAVRKICKLAGRFRRVAQSRQRQKADHG